MGWKTKLKGSSTFMASSGTVILCLLPETLCQNTFSFDFQLHFSPRNMKHEYFLYDIQDLFTMNSSIQQTWMEWLWPLKFQPTSPLSNVMKPVAHGFTTLAAHPNYLENHVIISMFGQSYFCLFTQNNWKQGLYHVCTHSCS